jgi:Uncharacterised protein family (UPF0149)
MPKPPRYLKQLEQELLALGDDAMLLEELDGFIAGLLVCPELIKPSEWLPVVRGSEGEDEPTFDSLDHLNRVLGLVMEHYNDVARTLIEPRYGPRFAVDKRHNEILWEIWVAGSRRQSNCGRRLGRNSLPLTTRRHRRCPACSRSPMSTAATRASHLSSSTL